MLDDRVGEVAGGHRDDDLVALLPAEQGAADGRLVGDPAVGRAAPPPSRRWCTSPCRPSPSSSTVEPIWTWSVEVFSSMRTAFLIIASRDWIRPSTNACSFLASSYSAFSVRSPCSLASWIRCAISGGRTLISSRAPGGGPARPPSRGKSASGSRSAVPRGMVVGVVHGGVWRWRCGGRATAGTPPAGRGFRTRTPGADGRPPEVGADHSPRPGSVKDRGATRAGGAGRSPRLVTSAPGDAASRRCRPRPASSGASTHPCEGRVGADHEPALGRAVGAGTLDRRSPGRHGARGWRISPFCRSTTLVRRKR